jgi:hypothetical protein
MFNTLKKTTVFFLITAILLNTVSPAFAAGTILPPNYNSATAPFPQVTLQGIKLDTNNPFVFEFLFDAKGTVTQKEFAQQVEYFLACLTLPQDELWVNLSPYEPQRICADELALTALGKGLLSQDYLLKQLASGLTHPETPQGKKYWNEINNPNRSLSKPRPSIHPASGRDTQGADCIETTQSFNRVWITTGKAMVYEHADTAVIKEANLKVMMEEDYLAMQKNSGVGATLAVAQDNRAGASPAPTLNPGTESFKTHILPLIQTEVNTGNDFAQLRQIYHAFILASWFKKKLKDSIYKYYIDQKKINGIDINDKNVKENVYSRYLEAFKKGAYDYVKRERVETQNFASLHKITKRRYFSGGIALEGQTVVEHPQPEVVADLTGQLRTGAVELVGAAKDPFASDSAPKIFNIAFGLTAAPELAQTVTKIAKPVANIDIDGKLRLYGYEFTGRNAGDRITCSSSCLIDPAMSGNFGLYRRHVLVLPRALEDKENPLTKEIILFINQFISSLEKVRESAAAELMAQAMVVWYLNPGADKLTPRQNYLLKIFAANATSAQALLRKTQQNLTSIGIIKSFASPEIALAYAQNQELFAQRLKEIISAEPPAQDDSDTVVIPSEPSAAPLPKPAAAQPVPAAPAVEPQSSSKPLLDLPVAPMDGVKARLFANTYFNEIGFGELTPKQAEIIASYKRKPKQESDEWLNHIFYEAARNTTRGFSLSHRRLIWFQANQAAFCHAIIGLNLLPEEISSNTTTRKAIKHALEAASEKKRRITPTPGVDITAEDTGKVDEKLKPQKKVTNALPLTPISFSAVMLFVKKYSRSVEFGELTPEQTSLVEAYGEIPSPDLADQINTLVAQASENMSKQRVPGLAQDEVEWFHANQEAFRNELRSALAATPTAPTPDAAIVPVLSPNTSALPLAPHYSGDEAKFTNAYYEETDFGELTQSQAKFIALCRAQGPKLSPERRQEAMAIFRYASLNVGKNFWKSIPEKNKRIWFTGNQAALCKALLSLGILPENVSTDQKRLGKIERVLKDAVTLKKAAPQPSSITQPEKLPLPTPLEPSAPVVKFTRIPAGVPWKAPAAPKDNREVEKFMLAYWKQSVSPDALTSEQRHFIALALEEPNAGLENRLRAMFNQAVENIETDFSCFESHPAWQAWFWANQATFCQYLIALLIANPSEIPGTMAKIKRYAPQTPDLKLNAEDDAGGVILQGDNLTVQGEVTNYFVVSEETALRFKNTPVVSYKILFF